MEAAQCFHQRVRRRKTGGDGVGQLAAQRNASLVGEIACLGETEIADDGLEALRIELPVHSLEIRIRENDAHGLCVGLSQSELAHLLVERRLGDGLLQHLTVEPEGTRLFLRQRTAELPPDLLQAIAIDLAELIQRDLGAADLGERRLPEPPEDVCNAPDTETDDQRTHRHRHDGLAEPV